jgi:hypothetical protein
MQLFVAQMQGLGEIETAFYNVGVFSTKELAEAALRDLAEEAGLEDAETVIEKYTLDV